MPDIFRDELPAMDIRLLFTFLIWDDVRTKYNQKTNYKALFGRIGQFQSELSENSLTFSHSTPAFRMSHENEFSPILLSYWSLREASISPPFVYSDL